nr:mucin-like protein 2 [Plectrocnemia conspersa]
MNRIGYIALLGILSLHSCIAHSCKENEEYKVGNHPERSCKDLFPIHSGKPIEGCFCISKHVRDSKGNCIKPVDCPQMKWDPAVTRPNAHKIRKKGSLELLDPLIDNDLIHIPRKSVSILENHKNSQKNKNQNANTKSKKYDVPNRYIFDKENELLKDKGKLKFSVESKNINNVVYEKKKKNINLEIYNSEQEKSQEQFNHEVSQKHLLNYPDHKENSKNLIFQDFSDKNVRKKQKYDEEQFYKKQRKIEYPEFTENYPIKKKKKENYFDEKYVDEFQKQGKNIYNDKYKERNDHKIMNNDEKTYVDKFKEKVNYDEKETYKERKHSKVINNRYNKSVYSYEFKEQDKYLHDDKYNKRILLKNDNKNINYTDEKYVDIFNEKEKFIYDGKYNERKFKGKETYDDKERYKERKHPKLINNGYNKSDYSYEFKEQDKYLHDDKYNKRILLKNDNKNINYTDEKYVDIFNEKEKFIYDGKYNERKFKGKETYDDKERYKERKHSKVINNRYNKSVYSYEFKEQDKYLHDDKYNKRILLKNDNKNINYTDEKYVDIFNEKEKFIYDGKYNERKFKGKETYDEKERYKERKHPKLINKSYNKSDYSYEFKEQDKYLRDDKYKKRILLKNDSKKINYSDEKYVDIFNEKFNYHDKHNERKGPKSVNIDEKKSNSFNDKYVVEFQEQEKNIHKDEHEIKAFENINEKKNILDEYDERYDRKEIKNYKKFYQIKESPNSRYIEKHIEDHFIGQDAELPKHENVKNINFKKEHEEHIPDRSKELLYEIQDESKISKPFIHYKGVKQSLENIEDLEQYLKPNHIYVSEATITEKMHEKYSKELFYLKDVEVQKAEIKNKQTQLEDKVVKEEELINHIHEKSTFSKLNNNPKPSFILIDGHKLAILNIKQNDDSNNLEPNFLEKIMSTLGSMITADSSVGEPVKELAHEPVLKIKETIPEPIVSDKKSKEEKQCSDGEEWRHGIDPPPSCSNLFPKFNKIKLNCYCEENKLRNEEGQCVPVEECPQFRKEKSCSIGEEYRPGIKPEPTCEKFLPKIVDYTIIHDCFCREDHVRNQEGQCVLVSECNQKSKRQTAEKSCNAGEEYRSDVKPEPTCQNMYPDIVDTTPVDDCFCREDHVRNQEGQCVLVSECNQKSKRQTAEKSCNAGEEYRSDVKPEPTCHNMYPDIVDTTPVDDCFCREDHVRNQEGQCVLVSECNQKSKRQTAEKSCNAGEEYRSDVKPEPTCHNMYPDIVDTTPVDDCFCREDHVRNQEGQCVLVSECNQKSKRETVEKSCNAGEEYRSDVKPEPTCQNMSPDIVDYTPVDGCFCKEEYVRNDEGQCIFVNECNQKSKRETTVPTCPENEEYIEGLVPEPTCEQMFSFMSDYEVKPGCYCMEYYIRNNEGKCTLIKDCPQFIEPETNQTKRSVPIKENHISSSVRLIDPEDEFDSTDHILYYEDPFENMDEDRKKRDIDDNDFDEHLEYYNDPYEGTNIERLSFNSEEDDDMLYYINPFENYDKNHRGERSVTDTEKEPEDNKNHEDTKTDGINSTESVTPMPHHPVDCNHHKHLEKDHIHSHESSEKEAHWEMDFSVDYGFINEKLLDLDNNDHTSCACKDKEEHRNHHHHSSESKTDESEIFGCPRAVNLINKGIDPEIAEKLAEALKGPCLNIFNILLSFVMHPPIVA